MAEAASGSAGSQSLPGTTVLATDRLAECSVRLTGLSSLNDRSAFIASAASTPGTYGAVAVGVIAPSPLSEFAQPTQILGTPGGGLSVNFRIRDMDLSTCTSGHHLYFLVFPITTPISGTVPDLVLDLGEIG